MAVIIAVIGKFTKIHDSLFIALLKCVLATVTASILMILMIRRRNLSPSPPSNQPPPIPSGMYI